VEGRKELRRIDGWMDGWMDGRTGDGGKRAAMEGSEDVGGRTNEVGILAAKMGSNTKERVFVYCQTMRRPRLGGRLGM
jgi:hypothetical protein